MSAGQYDVVIVILLALIFIKLYFPKIVSNFSGVHLRPYSYDIQGTGNEPSDFFKLPVDMKCTPGPSKDSSYYSTETSGGICGDGQFVNQQMKNYKIM
jgi:hypothetical protein